jgi:type IV pilus biogenesis protein CpaD/CtpE
MRNYDKEEEWTWDTVVLMAFLWFFTLQLLTGCGPEDKDTTPEISDPFRPPTPALRAAHRLQDGSIVLLVERAQ